MEDNINRQQTQSLEGRHWNGNFRMERWSGKQHADSLKAQNEYDIFFVLLAAHHPWIMV